MFKKNLALVLAVCMLFGMISVTGMVGARAEDTTVEFDFTQLYSATTTLNTVSSTDNSVTLTFALGTNTNNQSPQYNTSGKAVRFYAGNTLVVSSAQSIKNVAFTITQDANDNNKALKPDSGSITDGVWTGSSTSITFKNEDTKQVRFSKIVVTLGEGGTQPSPTETEEPTPFVKPTTPEEIVNAAYDLAVGETLQDGPYTLTGEVTEIAYAYQTGNTSISVWIVVGDMTDKRIECYKLENGENFGEGEGIAVVKVGDTITVTGELTRFNASTVEFKAGCKLIDLVPGQGGDPFVRPTTPEEIVDAAYDLAVGATLPQGPYTLTGRVTEIAYAYQTGATSISVWIVVGDMTDKRIECYKMKNGENFGEGEGIAVVKVGDTITVTGELTRFNASTVEFKADCTLDALVSYQPHHYETPEEILEAAAALAVGETLEGGPYELTGTVTEIVEEYSDKYGNITFKMSVLDYEVEGYRIKNGTSITAGEGVEILGVGDTVTLKGDIKNYNGTIEFVQNSTLEDIEYIAKVIRASLILQENLDINFRLITDQFDATTDEIGLQVVLNGKTTICEGEADDENDKQYIYTFENITPALMADEMTVTVLVNGEPVHEITYSVAEYCYKLLRQTDNATLKTLLVDLLIYGAKAQLYINHNVENLADKGLTDDELDFATPDDELPELENVTQIAGKIDEEDAIYSFKSVGLNLTDGIIIRVKLVLNEGKEHSAAASLCINSYIDGLLEETSVPGTYYAYAKVDNPTFFDTGIQLRVVNQGELNPSLSHTLYTSAASYCASILAKCADGRITDEALKDIVVALVKYAYSVKAYANIVNN